MKYKIHITPEGTKYVGYATGEGGEVVFKTTPHRLVTGASQELTKLIKYNTPQTSTENTTYPNIIDSVLVKNTSSAQQTQVPAQQLPRKCCGRG